VGIDLGGTAVKAGAITREGKILEEAGATPEFKRGASAVLDQLAELGAKLGARECGLGIGVPGLLRRKAGFVIDSPNLPGFRALAVKEELAKRLDLPADRVRVENDANAAALGEQWLGGAKGERDVLLVTLGTGIGGGLILNGELYAGEDMAGEVGHVVIHPGGEPCGCGGRGCVEKYASATAAKRRALERRLPRDNPGDLKLLCDEARSGDGPARQLLHEIGVDLGRGLGPVVCLLDLRCYVFGGGFAAALDTLEPGIRVGIDERSYGKRASSVRLLGATLGPAAGWIGAARLNL
jgi:glucokinase